MSYTYCDIMLKRLRLDRVCCVLKRSARDCLMYWFCRHFQTTINHTMLSPERLALKEKPCTYNNNTLYCNTQ